MKAATVALLVGAAGCSDPVVQLQLRISPDAQGFDMSCLTTAELYADGGNFPANTGDYLGKQVKLDMAPMSYDDLHTALHGAFDVPIPNSGLSTIEIYGWAGDSGFNQPAIPPDLLFEGSEAYIGQDTVELTVVPNVSCKQAQMKVRPIDILKLTTSAGATTAARCADAAVADTALNAGVSFGTLSLRPVLDTTDYWGGLAGASLTGGVAIATGPNIVGTESCLAFNAGMDTEFSISCSSGGKGVCALDGEIEAAVLDKDIAFSSLAQPYGQQYGAAVVVGVWKDNAGVRGPVSGAKVILDNPDLGTVVYVEPDSVVAAGGKGKLNITDGATATGASGLAMVYTKQLVGVTITAGNLTKSARIGAVSGYPSGLLVQMN